MTREKFVAYEAVRQSGETNMFAITVVCRLSGGVLTREDCLDIMGNYEEYCEMWPEVRRRKGGAR